MHKKEPVRPTKGRSYCRKQKAPELTPKMNRVIFLVMPLFCLLTLVMASVIYKTGLLTTDTGKTEGQSVSHPDVRKLLKEFGAWRENVGGLNESEKRIEELKRKGETF